MLLNKMVMRPEGTAAMPNILYVVNGCVLLVVQKQQHTDDARFNPNQEHILDIINSGLPNSAPLIP